MAAMGVQGVRASAKGAARKGGWTIEIPNSES